MSGQSQRSFIYSAPIIAKVFGNQFGVNIEYGHEPATDGNTIYLPTIPFDADERFIQLMNGYLDHEVAHIQYTNFDVYQSEYNSGPFRGIKNAIEDVWIEEKHACRYPGCRLNLDKTMEILIDDNQYMDGIETPAEALGAYVASWGRAFVRNQSCVESVHKQAASKLQEHLGDVGIFKLEALLSSEYPNVQSTADTIRLTALIEKTVREIEDEQDEDNEQSSSGDAHSGGADGSGNQQQNISSDTADIDTPFDFGKALSAAAEEASDNQPAGMNPGNSTDQLVPSVTGHTESDLKAFDQAATSINGAVQQIQQQLEALIALKRMPYKKPSNRGRLKPRKVARAAMGESKVFTRKYHRDDFTEPAISLLLDASSSMDNYRSTLALSTAVAIAESCNRLDIPLEISAFASESYSANIYLIKSFDQQYGDKMGALGGYIKATRGSTPMTEGLIESGIRLMARPESNRILLAITDGAPDNRGSCLDICQRLENELTLIGIGMGTDSVKDLFSQYVVVDDVQNIGQRVMEALSQSILKAA